VKPVSYSVDTPFDGFVVAAGGDMWVVDAEDLCGSGVPSGTLINGDEVEDALMGMAVHCEAESDRHCDKASA